MQGKKENTVFVCVCICVFRRGRRMEKRRPSARLGTCFVEGRMRAVGWEWGGTGGGTGDLGVQSGRGGAD